MILNIGPDETTNNFLSLSILSQTYITKSKLTVGFPHFKATKKLAPIMLFNNTYHVVWMFLSVLIEQCFSSGSLTLFGRCLLL